MQYISTLIVFLSVTFFSFAQNLSIPRNIDDCYNKGTRSKDGMPGPDYWQNTASYDINIDFDPETRRIDGSERIVFENKSPDTLFEIVFKLYPNYYKKGAPRDNDIRPEDLSDGMKIKEIVMDGKALEEYEYSVLSTNMILRTKLSPGKSITFKIGFSYQLNEGSHNRMGQVDKGSYFVAYFFPRITVYDDIDGWNLYPYTGSYEFYNDFSRFKLAVTVPSRFLVWATGDHINKNDVYTPRILERINRAENYDGFVNIIDSNDLAGRNDITNGNTSNTWKFEASNISDMVFAVSDHYIWQSTSLIVDSASGRRTRVDAVFNPIHKDYFHVVADARKIVESMSFRFPKWPFPYAHETVFDGLDQMEYPMMANDNPLADRSESIELTDHEIFHTLFPFYMGINETKYGWMRAGLL